MPFVYLNVLYVCVHCMCVLYMSFYMHLLLKLLSSILYWVDISYKNVTVKYFNSQWLAGAVSACQ